MLKRFWDKLSGRQTAHRAARSIEQDLAEMRFAQSQRIYGAIADHLASLDSGKPEPIQFKIAAYVPPVGVAPASHVKGATLAMDATITNMQGSNAQFFSLLGFPGFPFLTELAQISEYRDISERSASEMVRKWVKFRSVGNKDQSEKIQAIEACLRKHHVRDLFRQCAVYDGFFGRSQLFVNLGDTEGSELATPLILSPAKIKKGSLKCFKIIEPITTYPAQYNASRPLQPDYYKPSSWFVYGQEVHSSRLLLFESRPLPDLLKPVYNFSGISLSQLAQPYVDYWLNTRESVGKLLRNFSTTSLSTDLSGLIATGGDELLNRIRLFTQTRDNQGIFLLDSGMGQSGEQLSQINTPLSGLDKLQAQAQEHMAAVAKTPLSILLGITPTGLNASSDSEIRIFYDYVSDQQEVLFRRNLETVVKIIQLSEFGEIDDDVVFDFVSLYAMTEKELSLIRKSNAESDQLHVQLGAVSPEEVRHRLANDPDSGWNNLVTSEGIE